MQVYTLNFHHGKVSDIRTLINERHKLRLFNANKVTPELFHDGTKSASYCKQKTNDCVSESTEVMS